MENGPMALQSGECRIKISSRNLLELLAGRITTAEFNEVHGWRPVGADARGVPNPFERNLSQGRTIREMRVKFRKLGNPEECKIRSSRDNQRLRTVMGRIRR
jgi:hypothetical protein